MATESSDPGARLPENLSSWLDERASDLGVDRDELLRQLVAAYRLQIEEEPEVTADADLAALEDDVEAKLDDVRRRVVQVKQEVDGKAAADHSHRELARVPELADRLEELDERLGALEAAAEARDDRLDDVVARVDDQLAKLTRVARAVVGLQRRGGDDELTRIKQTAAREGYGRAVCEACGETVDVGLLGAATCPHCAADLVDVEPSPGWFRKPRLVGEAADE